MPALAGPDGATAVAGVRRGGAPSSLPRVPRLPPPAMPIPSPHPETRERTRVAPQELRWTCDAAAIGFRSTADVEPVHGVVGQRDAVEALAFGLDTDAPGMNVYVRGLTGTGRMRLVKTLLEDSRTPAGRLLDRCFVRNFEDPDRPALLSLPCGRGREFRQRVDELIVYIREELLPALGAESMRTRRRELEERIHGEMEELGAPFERELAENGLTMVMLQGPASMRSAVLPLIDGKAAPPERVRELIAAGELSREDAEQLRTRVEEYARRLDELTKRLDELREEHRERMRALVEGEARRLLEASVDAIARSFPEPGVERFLAGIVEDVVGRQLGALGEGKDVTALYRVNLVLDHGPDDSRPIVVETQPSYAKLLGTIERQLLPGGGAFADHSMIRAGSILSADGGYLVLEAREVLSEPGAWRVLMRTLRTGRLEISGVDSLLFGLTSSLRPEPISVRVKVVLIGDPGLYHLLDAGDPDFGELFKVLVDFDREIPCDAEAIRYYAGVLSRLARDESLVHFGAAGVAALAEHGARVAGRNDRLSTRFGRLADLAREASYLARSAGAELVEAAEVREAVRRTRRRGDLPARKFREAIAEGTVHVATTGNVLGQINGLAVTSAGPLTYGFPVRITASIGTGHAGAIDIEGESQLSGAIHTKGFHILGGLLRHLLRGSNHPLAFSASIAFEQSYGTIDGDSASGAEVCCLLSALTGVPLSQSAAMTGAIDQHGRLLPVGAVSEKIEGFFDVCADARLTGDQGVVVPAANRRNLVLREEVLDACREERFHVWAVETIHEALEVLTGRSAGELGDDGRYPAGSLLRLAAEEATEYWRRASAQPGSVPDAGADADASVRECSSAELE